MKTALAAVAHPDDIEFMMAGTMLLLKQAGWNIHFWNLANGSCGTQEHPKQTIIKIREQEAETSAKMAEAVHHPAFFDDLAIFYDAPSLAAVSAVVRDIQPDLILTHYPSDYMEDHQNVCRLITTAAFSRSMINYKTSPHRSTFQKPIRIYHALPHGLKDAFGCVVSPDLFIDIESQLARTRELLACHVSQKKWLDASQGMDAYLDEMEALCAEMGTMSKKFRHAEAFARHHYIGFCDAGYDPLQESLSSFFYQPTS